MTSSRDNGYDNTISGLLRERAELFGEAERLRDRIAEIRNDTEALDRTLVALGYLLERLDTGVDGPSGPIVRGRVPLSPKQCHANG